MDDSDAKLVNGGLAATLVEHLERCLLAMADDSKNITPAADWLHDIEALLSRAAIALRQAVLVQELQQVQDQLKLDVASALAMVAVLRHRQTVFTPD